MLKTTTHPWRTEQQSLLSVLSYWCLIPFISNPVFILLCPGNELLIKMFAVWGSHFLVTWNICVLFVCFEHEVENKNSWVAGAFPFGKHVLEF